MAKNKKSKLEGKLLLVKVGDHDRPAGPQDIKDVQKILGKVLKGIKCRTMVTHHCVEIEIVD